MSSSLYERLGGAENVIKIASSLVENHSKNPAISTRFANIDKVATTKTVSQFISSGTGGPNTYEGKDMLSTHKGMNISATEFVAVLDDALNALRDNGVGQSEQEEMLFILYSMRDEIILV